MVLGMISETNRISSVISAEAIPSQASPNTTVTWAPTPVAPTVWAMVLSVRIAASGWSMLRFRSLSLAWSRGLVSRTWAT